MKFKISIISFITIFLLSFSLNAYALEQYYEISDIKDIKSITTSGDTANLKVFDTPITITKLKLLSPTGSTIQSPGYDIIYVFEDNTEKVVLQNSSANSYNLTAVGQVYSTSEQNVKTIKVKKTGSTDSTPLRGKLLIYYDDGYVLQEDEKILNINPKGLPITSIGIENAVEVVLDEPIKVKEFYYSYSGVNQGQHTIRFFDDKGNQVQELRSSGNSITNFKINFPTGSVLNSYKIFVESSSTTTKIFNGTFRVKYEKYVPPPVESFKLVTTNKDYENNTYKFIFNKTFTVNVADLEFKDGKGNAVEFTHSVSNNELIISPTTKLENGTYNIKVKKLTSTEGEELTNITTTLTIKSNFYVTSKDFNNFISTETKELNLSFNKNLVVNTITMGDLTVTKTVDGNKLKINLPALAEETNYPLSINVTSIDNEKLELNYNLSTKSITGNKDLDKILYPVLQLFEIAKVNGKVILILAIGVGVIFISAMWLWGKAKSWLKSV